jgi:hypothetical protein
MLDLTHRQVTSVAEGKHIEMLILTESEVSSGQVGPAQVAEAVERKAATARAFDFNQIDIEFRQHLSRRKFAGILLSLRIASEE